LAEEIMQHECATSQCGRPTHDRICALHRGELVHALRQLAGGDLNLLVELEVTATRQARLGGPVGIRTGGEKPVFFHESASALVADLRRELLTWGEAAAQAWTHLRRRSMTPRETAAWLASKPGLLAGLDGVEVMHQRVTSMVRRAWRMIDAPADFAYLGQCSAATEAGECPRWLYAPKDDSGVPAALHQCTGCGAVHDVRARQRHMLEAMREVRGTAVDMSRIFARFGVALKPALLRKWKQRGLLVPADPGEEPLLYRLRDVEARLFPDTSRKEAS
jgi:hypothetical protein